jgi:hypothetical protein
MFIYVITNNITGKVYIGQHKGSNLKKYLQQKQGHAKRGESLGSYLYASMRKHPKEVWSIEPLFSDIQTKATLDRLETLLIALYDTRNPEVGYNICTGGGGAAGWVPSEETKKRISASNKGKHRDRLMSPENQSARIAAWQVSVDARIASGEYHSADTISTLKSIRAAQDESVRLEAFRKWEVEHGTDRRVRAANSHRGTKHKMTEIGAKKMSSTFKLIAHNRWHVKRQIKNPNCELCSREVV